jgi:hypothetical protein
MFTVWPCAGRRLYHEHCIEKEAQAGAAAVANPALVVLWGNCHYHDSAILQVVNQMKWYDFIIYMLALLINFWVINDLLEVKE